MLQSHPGLTARFVLAMLASFSAYYLPALTTISTLAALGAVYFTRLDRSREVVDKWLAEFRVAQERVAEAVIELTDAARRDHFEKAGENVGWRPSGEGVIPPVMRVPRMKLRAALALLPSAGLAFPKCAALAAGSQAEVIRDGDAALDEVAASLNQLAQGSAKARSARSHSPWKK